MSRHRLFALLAAACLAGTVQAQGTVLREEPQDNSTILYVDGGAAGGEAAQNNGRIVRIERWACPLGAVRPRDGQVGILDPVTGRPGTVSLQPRQCLNRIVDPDSGVERFELVNMVRMGDLGGYVVAIGREGDQLGVQGSAASDGVDTAIAAAAAAAAVGGFYSSCTPNPFAFCSGGRPNCRRDPFGCWCYSLVCPFGHLGQ